MKASRSKRRSRRGGFTLLEMSLVIFVLIALMTTGMMFSNAIGDWKAGREASETLRSAYVAQRTYLADHPTTAVSSLTKSALIPYLPTQDTSFPTVMGLDGVERTINVTVSPPVVNDSGGGTYDPSGDPSDSLWDVGE